MSHIDHRVAFSGIPEERSLVADILANLSKTPVLQPIDVDESMATAPSIENLGIFRFINLCLLNIDSCQIKKAIIAEFEIFVDKHPEFLVCSQNTFDQVVDYILDSSIRKNYVTRVEVFVERLLLECIRYDHKHKPDILIVYLLICTLYTKGMFTQSNVGRAISDIYSTKIRHLTNLYGISEASIDQLLGATVSNLNSFLLRDHTIRAIPTYVTVAAIVLCFELDHLAHVHNATHPNFVALATACCSFIEQLPK